MWDIFIFKISLALESSICKVHVNINGNLMYTSKQFAAYADDINYLERNIHRDRVHCERNKSKQSN